MTMHSYLICALSFVSVASTSIKMSKRQRQATEKEETPGARKVQGRKRAKHNGVDECTEGQFIEKEETPDAREVQVDKQNLIKEGKGVEDLLIKRGRQPGTTIYVYKNRVFRNRAKGAKPPELKCASVDRGDRCSAIIAKGIVDGNWTLKAEHSATCMYVLQEQRANAAAAATAEATTEATAEAAARGSSKITNDTEEPALRIKSNRANTENKEKKRKRKKKPLYTKGRRVTVIFLHCILHKFFLHCYYYYCYKFFFSHSHRQPKKKTGNAASQAGPAEWSKESPGARGKQDESLDESLKTTRDDNREDINFSSSNEEQNQNETPESNTDMNSNCSPCNVKRLDASVYSSSTDEPIDKDNRVKKQNLEKRSATSVKENTAAKGDETGASSSAGEATQQHQQPLAVGLTGLDQYNSTEHPCRYRYKRSISAGALPNTVIHHRPIIYKPASESNLSDNFAPRTLSICAKVEINGRDSVEHSTACSTGFDGATLRECAEDTSGQHTPISLVDECARPLTPPSTISDLSGMRVPTHSSNPSSPGSDRTTVNNVDDDMSREDSTSSSRAIDETRTNITGHCRLDAVFFLLVFIYL